MSDSSTQLQPPPHDTALPPVPTAMPSGLKAWARMILNDVGLEIQRVLEPLSRPLNIKGRQWNPVRIDAFYYGTEDRRLMHGFSWATIIQIFIFALFTLRLSCFADYDYMPEGGGSNEAQGKTVIVKAVKKPQRKIKHIISQFSPIRYEVPPIDEFTKEMDEQLEEETKIRYAAGMWGEGTGSGPLGAGGDGDAGFAAGSGKGKIRFIRLKHGGHMWDNNMGRNADYMMLRDYQIKSAGAKGKGAPIAEESEFKTVAEINNFAKFFTPPLVYITGKSFSVSDAEVNMLRIYLREKHGMILADALDGNFGRQFKATMRKILPDVQPKRIPMDNLIHRRPFNVGRLPYVAPHDPPMEAIGWYDNDGRLLVYYHPGDLADAWKEGHSGVKHDVWNAAYKLGCNIIYYAYSNYNQWLQENKVKQ